MSNQIIIKEFDDRRWMRSEVFQELMKIASKEEGCGCECDKEQDCDNCGCGQASDDEELLVFDQLGFTGDPMNEDMMEDNSTEIAKEKSMSEQFDEDEAEFSEIVSRLSDEAEELIEEGKTAEAFVIERKVRQIKYNLREMEKLA